MAKQQKETELHQKYLAEYNRLAKKADRRMRELERFSRYKEYESILDYAYKVAKRDIQSYEPPGAKERAPRWQRNEPMDTRTLKAKIADINKFLKMKSSTVTGVRKIYENRAKALNKVAKENGEEPNFTWQQLADFFEMGLWDKGKDKYGSATLLISIGVMKKKKAEVANFIKNKTEDHIQLSDDVVINDTINQLLQNNKKDIKKLINKQVILTQKGGAT